MMSFLLSLLSFHTLFAIDFTNEQIKVLEDNQMPVNEVKTFLEFIPKHLQSFETAMVIKKNLAFSPLISIATQNHVFSEKLVNNLDLETLSFILDNPFTRDTPEQMPQDIRQQTYTKLATSSLFSNKKSFETIYNKCENKMRNERILANQYQANTTIQSYDKMNIPFYNEKDEVPSGTLLYYGSLRQSPKGLMKTIKKLMAEGKTAIGDDSVTLEMHTELSKNSPWNASTWNYTTASEFAAGQRKSQSEKKLAKRHGASSFILIIDSSNTITQKLPDNFLPQEQEVVIYRHIPAQNILAAVIFDPAKTNRILSNSNYCINPYAQDTVKAFYILMNLSFDLKFSFINCLYKSR